MDKIARKLIVGQLKQWPNKGLRIGKLSVEYDFIKKIGATNKKPIDHNLRITLALAKMIFQIGTKYKLNFANYVFNHTMKLAGSFFMQLPITFPSLTTRIILKQHPEVLLHQDHPEKRLIFLLLIENYLLGHMS